MSTATNPPSASPPPRRHGPEFGLLPGAIILVLGLGFLLDNLGLVHFQAWCLWPVIFIIVGGVKIARGGSHNLLWGALIAAFGAGLMLDCFHALPFGFWRLWPVFLIALGVLWLWSASAHPGGAGAPWVGSDWTRWQQHRAAWRAQRHAWRAQRRWGGTAWGTGAPASAAAQMHADIHADIVERIKRQAAGVSEPAAAPPPPDNWLQVSAIFSGINRRVVDASLEGASLFAFFGGCNMDLRPLGATSRPFVVEAHAFFGAIEIYVPVNWLVLVEGTGLFGAFEDQTYPPPSPEQAAGRLIVRGDAVFGGVVVKHKS